MSIPFLPRSLSARLALAGTLTLMYFFFSSIYLGNGFNPLSAVLKDEVLQAPLGGGDASGVVDTTKPQTQTQTQTQTNTPSSHVGSDSPAATTVTKQAPILLVSSYFPLEKQRYPQAKYDGWIKNYLGSISTHIYLYTTPELAPQLAALRFSSSSSSSSAKLTLTIDTNYSTPFSIPPLQGKEEMYLRIQKKDRERGRRSNVTDLYAVRNAKLFFMHTAIRNMKASQGVGYEYVFWNDIGSFKNEEHVYGGDTGEWPSLGKVEEVWEEGRRLTGGNSKMKKEEMIFVPMFDPPHSSMSMWIETMGPIDSKFSEGSFFGGTPTAVDWLTRAFYAYHDRFLSLELFVGKDTSLINALMFLYPERFITVWANDPSAPSHLALNPSRPPSPSSPDNNNNPSPLPLGQCGSIWHYYQFFLADSNTKETMRELWVKNALRWKWWGWWRSVDRTRCQDTRVLAVGGKEGVLKRTFGAGWNAPGHGVEVPGKVSWV